MSTIYWQPRWGILIALKEDGETQEDLAKRLGWDPSKISRIISGERKKTSIQEYLAIAKAQSRPISWYIDPPNGGMGVSRSSKGLVPAYA